MSIVVDDGPLTQLPLVCRVSFCSISTSDTVAILLQQDLDGDRASKCRVDTPKDGAHTASSDKSIEPKMVQLLALEELP